MTLSILATSSIVLEPKGSFRAIHGILDGISSSSVLMGVVAVAKQVKQIRGSPGSRRFTAQVMCNGRRHCEQRVSCALLPHFTHPSLLHWRGVILSPQRPSQSKPARSAGTSRPPMHATTSSPNFRSVVVDPVTTEQGTARARDSTSGRASSRRSAVL